MGDATDATVMLALKDKLKEVVLDDGTTKAFKLVDIDIEAPTAYSFNNMPVAVISNGQHDYDDENPTLGVVAVYVDVWTKSHDSISGGRQLTGKGGVEEVRRNVIEQVGHLTGPNLPAALTFISSTTPEHFLGGSPVNHVWHTRLTYTLIRG